MYPARPSHLPGILSLLTSAHDYRVSSEALERGPWRQLDASPRLITIGISFLPKLPQSNFGDAVMSGSSPLAQTSTLQACPSHDSSRLASASVIGSVSLARKGTRIPENYQAWIQGIWLCVSGVLQSCGGFTSMIIAVDGAGLRLARWATPVPLPDVRLYS